MLKFRLLTIVAASLLGLSAARAQDASEWDAETHTAARLIAGALVKTSDATFLRAGIEIKLDTGWKTYWRDPGDSGVPPTFDFSGSENVKAVTVLWPAPARFPDGAGGNSIGYLEHVVLPLRVAPLDATKRTSLKLKLGYDVCGNMCVPVDADLKLPLTGDGAEESAIEKAEVRVPRHLALGEGKERGLAILAVHREPGGAHERVVVDVAAPAGAADRSFRRRADAGMVVAAAGTRAGSVGGNGSTRQFSFELDGLPPDAQPKGAMLTFTAVSGDDAIEVPAHLD